MCGTSFKGTAACASSVWSIEALRSERHCIGQQTAPVPIDIKTGIK